MVSEEGRKTRKGNIESEKSREHLTRMRLTGFQYLASSMFLQAPPGITPECIARSNSWALGTLFSLIVVIVSYKFFLTLSKNLFTFSSSIKEILFLFSIMSFHVLKLGILPHRQEHYSNFHLPLTTDVMVSHTNAQFCNVTPSLIIISSMPT